MARKSPCSITRRAGRWMHHLEVRDRTELDDELAGWVVAAPDATA